MVEKISRVKYIILNLSKDYQKDITNNYTTIKSNNGKTNIETNNLTLVGIQDEVKNNMNTDLVKGNILETQLKEKHDSEYYDLGISYSLPLSIGNLNKKANDVMTDGINKIANTLSNSNNSIISSIGNGISSILKPNVDNNTLQPKTDSQSIMNVGNWSDSFKNTTVSYRDDNGFDFSASVNSTAQSVVLTGKGLKYGMIGTEEIMEFGRETLEKMDVPGIILSQPFSVVEGFLDYFVENDSVVIGNGKDYYVNGIQNKIADVKDVESKKDVTIRYNPTSGFLGDVIESGLGKLFNWNGLTAQLGSMNKIVANDLINRRNNGYLNNVFHSQGTIIGTGAMNILNFKGIKLNDTQGLIAVGPAVSNYIWNSTANNLSSKVLTSSTGDLNNLDMSRNAGSVGYVHDNTDFVRKITTLDMFFSDYKGEQGNLTKPNANSHTMSTNELYFKFLRDK